MELFEALYTTRAMRRMLAREVPDHLIPQLLDAAVRAPSGGGFQNWCFIVIRDREMKTYLGTLFDGDIATARAGRYRALEEQIARGQRSERLDAHAAFVRSMLHLAAHFAEVPLFIAALIQSVENTIWPGGSDLSGGVEPSARRAGARARERARRAPCVPSGGDLPAPGRAVGRWMDAREHRRARIPGGAVGRGAAEAGARGDLRRAVRPATDVDGARPALAGGTALTLADRASSISPLGNVATQC